MTARCTRKDWDPPGDVRCRCGRAPHGRRGEFGGPLQKLINQYAYGEVWGREAIPRKMRSLLALAMTCARSTVRTAAHPSARRTQERLQQGGDPRGAAAGGDLLRHSDSLEAHNMATEVFAEEGGGAVKVEY